MPAMRGARSGHERSSGSLYRELRSQIVRGELAPGRRLAEVAAAERFGVSRTPVREALARLTQEGFLVRTLDGGRIELAVAPLTAQEAGEVFRIVGALEGLAAMEVGEEPQARAALAAQSEEVHARFVRTANKRPLDFDLIFDLHRQFHDPLVAACTGANVRALHAMIRPRVERYEWMYAPLVGEHLGPSLREHEQIVSCLRRGPASALRGAIETNWANAAERLVAAMKRAPKTLRR